MKTNDIFGVKSKAAEGRETWGWYLAATVAVIAAVVVLRILNGTP